MDRSKKLRLSLGILFGILFIGIVIESRTDRFIQAGQIKEKYLTILGDDIDWFDTPNFITIGLHNEPEEYYIQYYEKEKDKESRIIEETKITLPKNKAYFVVNEVNDDLQVTIFDKEKKIFDKKYPLNQLKLYREERKDSKEWYYESSTLNEFYNTKDLTLYNGHWSHEISNGDDYNLLEEEGNYVRLKRVKDTLTGEIHEE